MHGHQRAQALRPELPRRSALRRAHRRRRRAAARRQHRRDRPGARRADRRARSSAPGTSRHRDRPRPRRAAARRSSRPTQLTLHVADALDVRLRDARAATCASSATCRTTSARRCCSTSRARDAQLRDVHVMLQKEVVARMTAQPGTAGLRAAHGDAAGALSHRAPVRRAAGRVPAGAEGRFGGRAPRAAARRTHRAIADAALFARVVAAAFAQRRKTLRNALSALCTPS